MLQAKIGECIHGDGMDRIINIMKICMDIEGGLLEERK